VGDILLKTPLKVCALVIGGMGLADALGATIPTPLFVVTSLLLGGMLGAKP